MSTEHLFQLADEIEAYAHENKITYKKACEKFGMNRLTFYSYKRKTKNYQDKKFALDCIYVAMKQHNMSLEEAAKLIKMTKYQVYNYRRDIRSTMELSRVSKITKEEFLKMLEDAKSTNMFLKDYFKEKGIKYRSLAIKYNINIDQYKRSKYSKECIQNIVNEKLETGLSWQQIAKKHNITRQVIHRKIKVFGINV